MRRRSALPLAAVAVVATVTLTGCSLSSVVGNKASEPYQDAPRTSTVNKAPAEVIEMPDGFSNLATKCDHGNRVYVVFHNNSAYGSVSVVPNDPSCKGQ